MTLWIIAGVASAILLAAVFVLTRKRDDDERWKARHSHPWDKRAEELRGTTVASLPPPAAGLPFRMSLSEEIDRGSALESTELWVDDEPTGPVAKIVLTAAGKSDPGKKREHNEDSLLMWPEQELYAIADGMGGYAAGEVASQLAIETLERAFTTGELGELEEGLPRRGAELMAAFHLANTAIRAEAKRDDRKTGMGTTLVAARFSPGRNRVYLAHVGDSRCYRIRDGHMRQLTTDHTLGAVGIVGKAAGKLSRAVGAFDVVEVDLVVDEPRPGDHYLLCSDGLYKMLSDSDILETVERGSSVEAIVEDLVAGANDRGGRDNVSVVMVRVDEPDIDLRESGEHRITG
jgi:protein phosphatase